MAIGHSRVDNGLNRLINDHLEQLLFGADLPGLIIGYGLLAQVFRINSPFSNRAPSASARFRMTPRYLPTVSGLECKSHPVY